MTPEPGPCGLPAISVAHYGEQHGDSMRDANMCFGMCFELTKPLSSPELTVYYVRDDYTGIEQYSRYRDGGNYIVAPDLFLEHLNFARMWDRNLRTQGFLKAFTDKSIRG